MIYLHYNSQEAFQGRRARADAPLRDDAIFALLEGDFIRNSVSTQREKALPICCICQRILLRYNINRGKSLFYSIFRWICHVDFAFLSKIHISSQFSYGKAVKRQTYQMLYQILYLRDIMYSIYPNIFHSKDSIVLFYDILFYYYY